MKKVLIKVLCIAAILLLGATVAASSVTIKSPGISMTVTPIDNEVLPGETATYLVSVTSETTETEHIVLSISDPTTGWVYTFAPEEFDIDPGASVSSTLSMMVPTDATVGGYHHTVHADAYLPGEEWLGVQEDTSYTNVLTSVIPEFPTIAIPVAAIIGLFLLIRRRKKE